MKKVLLIGLVSLSVLSSCGRRIVTGKGETTTTPINVSGNFSKIDVSSSVTAHVQVQPGAQPSVQLAGYKNLLDEIETVVEGNTLHIRNKHSFNFDTDKEIVANITVGSLSELEIHGAADADVKGDITGNDFHLAISGAGDVSIEKLTVSRLQATISGAGNVSINSGSASEAEYKVSGAGNIDGFGIQSNDVKAKVSGAGNIQVYALKTLDAKVSGAGSIEYKGTASVKSETSGIGSVVAAN